MSAPFNPYADDSAPGEPDWLHGHPHEPNPAPPGADARFVLDVPHPHAPGERVEQLFSPADLARLPQTQVEECYIVSTGHGASGPFVFGGVRLADFLRAHLPPGLMWSAVDVISGDGFGNRVTAAEVEAVTSRPIVLATHVDGAPLRREQGVVRLIVPSETTDALRQVKWVARIRVYGM